MRILRSVGVGAALALAPVAASGGKFDGGAPVTCAAFIAMSCGSEGTCDQGTAESINVPEFFRLDLKGRKVQAIRADGSTTNTEIHQVELRSGHIHLQGIEGDRSWTATLSEESGRIVIAATADRVGFFVFGACLPGH